MTTAKGAGAKRKKSEETRSRIIEAGRETFMRKGYHDTRVSEIIARTGLGHGTFWLYFRDKEELLRVLVEEMLEQFVDESLVDQLAPDHLDPRTLSDIEQIISRVVQVFENNQPLHQAVLEAAMQSEEFAGIYDQINLELARVFQTYLSFLLPAPGNPEGGAAAGDHHRLQLVDVGQGIHAFQPRGVRAQPVSAPLPVREFRGTHRLIGHPGQCRFALADADRAML
jgi:AcrR family transcriptional regulator